MKSRTRMKLAEAQAASKRKPLDMRVDTPWLLSVVPNIWLSDRCATLMIVSGLVERDSIASNGLRVVERAPNYEDRYRHYQKIAVQARALMREEIREIRKRRAKLLAMRRNAQKSRVLSKQR